MTSLLERPADVAALRSLLARAKAAGWNGSPPDREHTWTRSVDEYQDRVIVDDVGNLLIYPAYAPPWQVPILSADQVGKVLELAKVLPGAPVVGDRVMVDPDRQSGVVTDVIRDADGEVWEYDVRLAHGQVIAAQPGHVHPLPAGPHAGQPGHRWEDCPDLHTGQHPEPGDPALPLPAHVEGYPLGGELVEDAWPDPNHRGEL